MIVLKILFTTVNLILLLTRDFEIETEQSKALIWLMIEMTVLIGVVL